MTDSHEPSTTVEGKRGSYAGSSHLPLRLVSRRTRSWPIASNGRYELTQTSLRYQHTDVSPLTHSDHHQLQESGRHGRLLERRYPYLYRQPAQRPTVLHHSSPRQAAANGHAGSNGGSVNSFGDHVSVSQQQRERSPWLPKERHYGHEQRLGPRGPRRRPA